MPSMEHASSFLAGHPLIALHLGAALLALLVGIVVMQRRKGNASHKVLGWTWVVMMGVVAISSAFIRDHGMPNIGGYTPIHAFTLTVAVTLPLGIWHARRRHIGRHRAIMRSLFYGACVAAGLFTLLPGRFLGDLLWKHALQVMA